MFQYTDKLKDIKDIIEIKFKEKVQSFVLDHSSYKKSLCNFIKELINSKQNQLQEKNIISRSLIPNKAENENKFEIDTSSKQLNN